MDRAYGNCGWKMLRGENRLEDRNVDGWTILKRTSSKQDSRV